KVRKSVLGERGVAEAVMDARIRVVILHGALLAGDIKLQQAITEAVGFWLKAVFQAGLVIVLLLLRLARFYLLRRGAGGKEKGDEKNNRTVHGTNHKPTDIKRL